MKSTGEVRRDQEWIRSTITRETLEEILFEGIL